MLGQMDPQAAKAKVKDVAQKMQAGHGCRLWLISQIFGEILILLEAEAPQNDWSLARGENTLG